MKTINQICLLIIVLTTLSCKREMIVDFFPNREPQCNVSMVEHTYTEKTSLITDKYYYQFDDQFRITKITTDTRYGKAFEEYAYLFVNNNNVICKTMDDSKEEFEIPFDFKLYSITQHNNLYKLTYNDDGKLIEIHNIQNKQSFMYLDGNLISSDFNDKPYIKILYSNELSKDQDPIINRWIFGGIIDFDGLGYRINPHIPKLSKNLPSTIIYNPGPNEKIHNITYKKDDSNRIMAIRFNGDGNTSMYKFEYECK